MSTPEPTVPTSTTDDTSATPPPTGTSEINAVPAGDASKEKTQSRVPQTSAEPEKTSSKPSGPKTSRRVPSTAKTEAPKPEADLDEGDEGASDAESEYETICIRRKKPTPFFQRLKRFLSNYLAFDIYMTSVMWEAFKIVVITSQFNWALEILGGLLHIFAAAGRCALKKQCGGSGDRRSSDTSETDKESTPEPEAKKSSMKSMAKPSSKPSSMPNKTPSKAPAAESTEPTTTTTSTADSGETKSSEPPTGETSPTTEAAEPTSEGTGSPA